MRQAARWMGRLGDAAVPAILLGLALDQIRMLRLGAAHAEPWILGAPVAVVAPVLVAWALGHLLRRRGSFGGAVLERLALVVLGLIALGDAGAWLALRTSRTLAATGLLPASLVIGVVLLGAAVRRRPVLADGSEGRRVVLRGAAVGAAGLLVVLLHLATFGATDYRQPADAVVVFGAKVHEDGAASTVLRDRTVTACRLYEQGWVRHLVFSGGHGPDAPLSEPAVMARIARARGIPAEAIHLDERGRNTWATVRELARKAEAEGWGPMLAVSTDLHLARVRLLARSAGLDVRTVPAVESMRWKTPVFVLRESLAWGWWYLRSALG